MFMRPGTNGTHLVWVELPKRPRQEDPEAGPGDLYLYNLDTQRKLQLAAGTVYHYGPGSQARTYGMSDKYVVWEDTRAGNSDIWLYNIATGESRAITTDPAWQFNPRVSGDLVVWGDKRNGRTQIYLRDLSKPVSLQSDVPITSLLTSPAGAWVPAISGNRIAWMNVWVYNYRNAVYTCLYDPASGKCPIEPITFDRGQGWYPQVSDDAVMWFNGSGVGRNDSLFAADLPSN